MQTNTMPKSVKDNPVSAVRGQILLIEDNPKNRKLIRSLLRINHFSLLEAPDAETGIQLAKEKRPDLILMDIQLPGIDGLQATKILKADKALEKINIIALTSHAMEGDSEKALAAGCNGYLTKPINTREFIDQIAEYLPSEKKSDSTLIENFVEKNDYSTAKILIVDDEPMNLKLLRGKLSNTYGQIFEASDGKAALELAITVVPDLILSDIMMPGMDGFEFTRKLKASAKTCRIPVILITALDGHNYKVMGYEAGADDFLNKPLNTIELHSRVRSLLDLKQYQDKLAPDSESVALSNSPAAIGVDQSFPRNKILILMEDANQCSTIQMYLFGQPYHIICKGPDERDVDAICSQSPDIMVLEDGIHVNDLIDMCRAIKENPKTKYCQMLYLTDDSGLKKNFSLIGDHVDDFLTQPYNIYELRARIKVLLKKKALLDRLLYPGHTEIDNVITDPTTGLYTFEYCKHVLKHELQRSVREHNNVAFVNLAVRETLASRYASNGSLSEDAFSNTLSGLFIKSIRKLDIASRRSRCLFSFVLPEADEEKTKGFIKRIQGIIHNHLQALDPTIDQIEKELSFGYTICPDQSDQIETIIQIADAALEKKSQ